MQGRKAGYRLGLSSGNRLRAAFRLSCQFYCKLLVVREQWRPKAAVAEQHGQPHPIVLASIA